MIAAVLRLDAPMLSFGGVIVDHHGFTDRFPGTAMLCGLFGNALGYSHRDHALLHRLQERIVYAARWDVPPRSSMVDYHTVDLGSPHMRSAGWTTRGKPEHRDGGASARQGIHQRYRHYWCDGLMTVVVALIGDDAPGTSDVVEALCRPVRPLFLGRKTCLPARPLLDPSTPELDGDSVREILRRVPVWTREGIPAEISPLREASWTVEEVGEQDEAQIIGMVHDQRDWRNQVMAGSRVRAVGLLGGEVDE